MDEVREVASVALSVRKAARLRVRQPLASLTVATRNAERLRPFVSLLADEVNVREVELDRARRRRRPGVAGSSSVNARAAGPRLGRDVQKVIKASKAGDWTVGDDGAVVCGGFALVEGRVHPGTGRGRVVVGRGRSAAVRRVRRRWTPCWTTTWSPTGRSATCCGWCSRPARTPGWRSPTGSTLTLRRAGRDCPRRTGSRGSWRRDGAWPRPARSRCAGGARIAGDLLRAGRGRRS